MAGSTSDDPTTDHGCMLQGRWDWTTKSGTGRWSTAQQAIKFPRYFIPDDASNPRDSGFGVLKTRLKIRGHGDSLVLRYTSESGKDFQLLGWAIPYTVRVDD